MKIEHVVQETRKKITYVCDICKLPISGKIYQCPNCGRDICNKIKCSATWNYDPFTGDDNGDYPPVYCKDCNKLAIEYGNKTQAIQQIADIEIEELMNEWTEKCKQHRTKK